MPDQLEHQQGALRRLERALDASGWVCTALEVDYTAGTARVELRSTSGRYVTLDARGGRATITREQGVYVESQKRYGGKWDFQLLGRDRYTDARAAVDALSAYLAHNSPTAVGEATGPALLALLSA